MFIKSIYRCQHAFCAGFGDLFAIKEHAHRTRIQTNAYKRSDHCWLPVTSGGRIYDEDFFYGKCGHKLNINPRLLLILHRISAIVQ